jgi:hypothetical protein
VIAVTPDGTGAVWGAIAAEYLYAEPPASALGETEAEFLGIGAARLDDRQSRPSSSPSSPSRSRTSRRGSSTTRSLPPAMR